MSKTETNHAPFAYDGLDRVIHEKARLGMLTSLMAYPKGLAFADLKHLCGLTDGNLSRHLQVLQEAGLVEVLLRDVGQEPGALPLLSHALLETWRRRVGHRLTLAGYAAAGEVRGAIAQSAERVYADLSVSELARYFPHPMREPYRSDIDAHHLRREIIATRLVNAMIDFGGQALPLPAPRPMILPR